MDVFRKNSYPENIINSCFKTFSMTNIELKEKMIFVPKKLSFLTFPYFEGPLLQTRTTLSLKDTLNYFKLQILFKSQN